MAEIHIRPLTPGDVPAASLLLATLNPDTPEHVIRQRLGTILTDHPHYHLLGAFSDESLAGVAGAWVATKIWCGRYLEIDNLVVSEKHRSSGIGSQLIARLEALALELDCNVLTLDSYVSNPASHRLYHRLGFEIWGFHFIKPIGDWKGRES
ncbi:GNAT family N-acetyltransferase [Luteolibacter yonseiensis]|uniref:GNAT family N-acetyltransferase n=1 Tax=Luteolibacter yonseiensis TaxID=1144680 RepID=A0A934R860_9BACT|nr:GNAT family N-acetyltransferase [Luteolibacter yonseiensis]MBK1818072.1 GNAT family N-acetyltransferase [Luteolibacter yonseiensis]